LSCKREESSWIIPSETSISCPRQSGAISIRLLFFFLVCPLRALLTGRLCSFNDRSVGASETCEILIQGMGEGGGVSSFIHDESFISWWLLCKTSLKFLSLPISMKSPQKKQTHQANPRRCRRCPGRPLLTACQHSKKGQMYREMLAEEVSVLSLITVSHVETEFVRHRHRTELTVQEVQYQHCHYLQLPHSHCQPMASSRWPVQYHCRVQFLPLISIRSFPHFLYLS
jgi:hypothetical protein